MPSLLLYGRPSAVWTMVSDRAKERNLAIVLGGPDEAALKARAAKLGATFVVFGHGDSADEVDAAIQSSGAAVLLNCDAPFSASLPPLVAACLRTHVDYLDVSAEPAAAAHAQSLDAVARAKGVRLRALRAGCRPRPHCHCLTRHHHHRSF